MTRRVVAFFVVSTLIITACEDAEEDCRQARAAADTAWGTVVDERLEAQRRADEARDGATRELVTAIIDLGNVRSTAAEDAFGTSHDAFVGIEVSVGALAAAVLAADELFDRDRQAAERVVGVIREELDGRFAQLIELPLDGEDAASTLIETGDACSTRLQLLVREQTGEVRQRVLNRFARIEDQEGEPQQGIDVNRVKAALNAYLELTDRAVEAQDALDRAVAARDAVDDGAETAKEASQAVGGSGATLTAAQAASADVFTKCSAAGM